MWEELIEIKKTLNHGSTFNTLNNLLKLEQMTDHPQCRGWSGTHLIYELLYKNNLFFQVCNISSAAL